MPADRRSRPDQVAAGDARGVGDITPYDAGMPFLTMLRVTSLCTGLVAALTLTASPLLTAAMTEPVPASGDEAPAPPPPLLPTPSPRQLAWHDRDMYAFVHFNMNTFTDMEWGHGDESPETFHPTAMIKPVR